MQAVNDGHEPMAVDFGEELSEVFSRGITAMREQDYPAAERAFGRVMKQTPPSHEHYSLLASYLGLAQVLTGNEDGLLLCRDAASNEMLDGQVFLNLACAEWAMGNRKRTIDAIRRGVKVDAGNRQLNHACAQLDCRRRCCFNFLPRGHRLNRFFGRLRRRPVEPPSVHSLLFSS